MTVLFGGLESFDANQTSDETWTWDGKVWTQLHPYNNPPARFGAGLVYDPAHQVLVLYGGSGLSGWLTDTWTWDGSNWQQKSPAESPPAWAFSTLAYDATRKAVILYDGAALWPLNPINQTWSWDGGSWTRIQTPTNPNGDTLNSGAVAYDAATSQTIFVGPTGTWVLGTTDWSRLSGGGGQLATDQHGFNAFAVAFDSTRGVLVEVDAYGGTWTWDGKAWTATNSTAQPSARSGAVLVDDPVRQQLVLVGGADRMTVLFDTWVWNGTTWARAV